MKNRELIASMSLLAFCFIYITACQDNVGTSFEESIVSNLDLEPIHEASNTTLNVHRGEAVGLDSYFALDVSNVQPNQFVRQGLTEGWCAQWTKPINDNGADYRGVEMYSTFGSDRWKPANYLLNIKNDLKTDNPDLTYREIQVALWSVIDKPEFNLEKVLEDDRLPSRMKKNGEPNFNISKVKEIVAKVYSEFYENYEYNSNTAFATYGSLGENDQDIIIINDCVGFRTQTQGGWGAPAAGDNPGVYRDANFEEAFPDGLEVGGNLTLTLTSAGAVEDFLPSGGPPAPLSESVVDPTENLGTLAGNVVALTLSIGFDNFDPDFSDGPVPLEDLIFAKDDFEGWTVAELLEEANRVLGGGSVEDFTASQLNDAIDAVNNNFVDGDPASDPDLLKCPELLSESVL